MKGMRKKYWKKVERCLFYGNCRLAADMIMAIFTCDVERAAMLYQQPIGD